MSIAATSGAYHSPLVSRREADLILGGAALMMTLAMGMRQSLGLFQTPASQGLGIAVADFALAVSIQQAAWGGGYIFDALGSYDLAWKVAVLIGLIAGTAQLLMNDRPTARVAEQGT